MRGLNRANNDSIHKDVETTGKGELSRGSNLHIAEPNLEGAEHRVWFMSIGTNSAVALERPTSAQRSVLANNELNTAD